MRSSYFVTGLVSAALLSSALLTGCGGNTPVSPASPTPVGSSVSASGPSAAVVPEPAPAPDEVFVGAGDIAKCGMGDAEATSRLLDRIPGTVFTLGDNVQDLGSAEEYERCFEPTWGRHRSRMLTTLGNHDFFGGHGRPYFSYFGASAGPSGLGYYATTLGAWQIISLNTEIPAGPGSAQFEWLKAQLAASPAACTLAMWHRPLFTSGPNDHAAHMRDIWRLLSQHGAELVLSGHNHQYERFALQDADGRPDPRGMRQFVVGTGGYPLYGRTRSVANSEMFHSDAWGVLKLTLKSASYAWEFVPVDGKSFRDSGSAACTVPTAG